MISTFNLNNTKLVVEEIPFVRSAGIGVYIKVGSRHEKQNISGVSHFIEHMLFKGTEKRTAREIAESFEGMGGQLNAFTSKEYTCLYSRTLDENVDSAIEIMFDMLFSSKFAPKDFTTEKGVVIEEINMYEDTPDDLIHDLFSQKFWEGHSMGLPILGTEDSIINMDRDLVYEYYKKYYVPANMVIAVAGNVNSNKVRDKIQNLLEKQPKNNITINQTIPEENNSFISLMNKETEQVQLCLGVPSISYHNDNRYVQNVMNNILGGGLGSRLFQSIREELGLAYSVYSYPSTYSDTGAFSIYVGTSPSKVAQFFEALIELLDNFTNEGVSEEEVTRTQQLIKSSILLGLESVMNRMTRLARSIMIYDEIVSPEKIIDRIYAIDSEQVNQFAQNLFKKELFSLAAIGDKEILPNVEKQYKQLWRL
ncbi:peptidase, M16 family [Candidatus Syntrophocurvum alkaliphilum]|uniref:Peptidase, M16 family n=1 Tax=Candidatus Syntrophocurvum alkaliphilum TaxID=2293317 RepID=A0A6I6D8H8_9FIRM|nr:pitrilysin family protein [Candidatus Syntrophocurvum alkaliphilum]QGT99223.1 peptidase, M16 family [Candidatus Syntrophocurvum alkaliphilum]